MIEAIMALMFVIPIASLFAVGAVAASYWIVTGVYDDWQRRKRR